MASSVFKAASNLPAPGGSVPADLVRLAVALGAADAGGPLSEAERGLITDAAIENWQMPIDVEITREAIRQGHDPLGTALMASRSIASRREMGAIYTPPSLVEPMVAWTMSQEPARVVDAGVGSGRFSMEVLRQSKDIELVAVDTDPLATLLTRAAVAALGHGKAVVVNTDYTRLKLERISGRTAFVGNPPYVRHHRLTASQKGWAQQAAGKAGHTISGLAGLHTYFFLATALHGRPGDVGCFVTSSEWLDVNYGAIVRDLLLNGLGGKSVHVLDPTSLPFADTATTATISCFVLGEKPSSIRLRMVKAAEDLGDLEAGEPVTRQRLVEARRWSPLVRTRRSVPEGYVELGELCRVHRGAVTGLNAVWITSSENHEKLPDHVLYPTVTRARELFEASDALTTTDRLRRVIDLPNDLDVLEPDERKIVERFLRRAKRQGASKGYIARYRRSWWTVGLRQPAPILATYMARRPPAFVRNMVDARHINIAHGLYPRVELTAGALDRLAGWLRQSITVGDGRTYAGGLTKFEPKEMERIPVPDLAMLLAD